MDAAWIPRVQPVPTHTKFPVKGLDTVPDVVETSPKSAGVPELEVK